MKTNLTSHSKYCMITIGSPYKRIISDLNVKNLALPEFLRNYKPQVMNNSKLKHFQAPSVPPKPKVLQKYSKSATETSSIKTFAQFNDFISKKNEYKIGLRVHKKDIYVKELLNLKESLTLSRNLIDCALTVIKKKNRELTKKYEDYPRVLIGKTSFTEKLFDGQMIFIKVNIVKYDCVLFPVVLLNSWSLLCLDIKHLTVTLYNAANIPNPSVYFNYIKMFVSSQLTMESKNTPKPHRHIICKEFIEPEPITEKDSGVYMLKHALRIAVSATEDIKISSIEVYRKEILQMLYEYGKF
jgi:hypothetical protein